MELLDQSCKFAVLGPDENVWFFKWEYSDGVSGWHAYSRQPGQSIYLPQGTWSEASVIRFLNKHGRKLTDDDRINLYQYLYKGGFELFLRKNRMVGERNDSRTRSTSV